MVEVLLGIGSNIERRRNIGLAVAALRQCFGGLRFSSVYEAVAIGFDGEPFYNLVVGLCTDLELPVLQNRLKDLEAASGRTGHEARWSGRTLDIDILTYGDCVGVCGGVVLPRPEILFNAYVLQPLAELEPDGVHPTCGMTYAGLWRDFTGPRQLVRLSEAESLAILDGLPVAGGGA